MSELSVVPCTLARHGAAILAIFNEAIANSTALYDYAPRAPESMTPWFDAKARGGFPAGEQLELECGLTDEHIDAGDYSAADFTGLLQE